MHSPEAICSLLSTDTSFTFRPVVKAVSTSVRFSRSNWFVIPPLSMSFAALHVLVAKSDMPANHTLVRRRHLSTVQRMKLDLRENLADADNSAVPCSRYVHRC